MKLFGFTVELMSWVYILGTIFIGAYIIGSIPTGYIIVKAKTLPKNIKPPSKKYEELLSFM